MDLPLFIRKNILIVIVFFAAVIYICTAINSHGFYHADEHYQIIEFAGLKLGTHTPDEVAWEYRAKIRPALQPTLCFVSFKVFNSLGITDPYSKAFLLRLLSSILAISVITYFILKTRKLIEGKTNKIIYYLLSFFLWFIPVIGVRFSSETWSGLLFLVALAVFLRDSDNKFKPIVVGVLFGLSFLFRFQIAFAILGFGLWLIFIHHSKLFFLLKILLSFCVIVFLGFLLDSWFYGDFVFTPWNYFLSIIESGGSGFGTSTWYYYFLKFLSFPTYPIGVPLSISIVLLIIFKPKNIFLWCIIPFIIIHSFVPHKEERFLFPIVFLFPFILTEAYILITKLIRNVLYLKILKYSLLTIFISINSIGLIAMGQKSAGLGRMEITKYIHDRHQDMEINIISTRFSNPYDPWQSLPMKYYMETEMVDTRINNLCELSDSLIIDGAINFLVVRKIDAENKNCSEMIQKNHFVFEIQSIPTWVEKINAKYKGFENYNILELYRYSESK